MIRNAWMVLLLGCASGSAEYTNVTPYSGTLQLHGGDRSAMSHARDMMAKQCGSGNYAVLQDWHDAAGTHFVSFQCQNPGLAPQAPSTTGVPPPPPPR